MSEFFLYGNLNNANKSLINEDETGTAWSTSDIKEFKKRYRKERETRSTTHTSPSVNEKNENSMFQPLDLNGRYRSMVEDFVNERPSSNVFQSPGSTGLFLPFMEKRADLQTTPQRNERAQSSPNIADFLSRRISPNEQQQQEATYSSFSSIENSTSLSPNQNQQSPQQLGNVVPQLSSPIPSQLSSQLGQSPQLSNYSQPQFQGYQTDFSQGVNPLQQNDSLNLLNQNNAGLTQEQLFLHLFQQQQQQQQQQSSFPYSYMPPYMGPPQGNESFQSIAPYNSTQNEALAQFTSNQFIQVQQSVPESQIPIADFMSKLNLQVSPNLNVPTTTDQSGSNEEDVKKPKKPVLSLDNQLVYLYPRHAKMELTYSALNNVHVRYGSFMSTPDVYFIARNHLRDLLVVNPYVDDYYYIVYVTKKTKTVPKELTKWIRKSIEDRCNPPEKEEPPQYDTRLFGRISGITPKAPRVVVDNVELVPVPDNSSLNTDSLHLKCGIEECFDKLLIIDDFVICRGESEFDSEIENDAEKKSVEVVKFIQEHLLDIILMNKGVKLLDKAFRVLTQEHSFALLEATFYNWDQINRKTSLFKENTPLLKSLYRVIEKITRLSLISKLLTALIANKNVLIVRLLNPLFIQLMGMLLKKGGDIRDAANKEEIEEWNRCFTNLLFLNMKQIGFSKVIEKHPDEVSWMFLASIAIHCRQQHKIELLDQVRPYTDKPAARANPLIKAFLSVAKQ